MVAVNDGVIRKIGKSKKLGRYIVLARRLRQRLHLRPARLGRRRGPGPQGQQADGLRLRADHPRRSDDEAGEAGNGRRKAPAKASGPANTEDSRERLYALPERDANRSRADLTGQLDDLLDKGVPGYETVKAYFSGVLKFDPKTMDTKPLREGSQVVAGTVLGRDRHQRRRRGLPRPLRDRARRPRLAQDRPEADPRRLEAARGDRDLPRRRQEPVRRQRASVGQILLMSKGQLQQRVLRDPRIEIYSCGREDIRTGQIDRRILATLEYLAARGFRPTVTSLKCGHGIYTTSGNVSHHTSGNAVDIAQINGIPILGNQGRGSITEAVVTDLLKLQGSMQPAQIISLMEMGGPTFAMGDHADHIHVGFTPVYGPGREAGRVLRAAQPEPVGQAAQPDRRARPARGADRPLQVRPARPRASAPPTRTSASSRRSPSRVAALPKLVSARRVAASLRPTRLRGQAGPPGRPLPGPPRG